MGGVQRTLYTRRMRKWKIHTINGKIFKTNNLGKSFFALYRLTKSKIFTFRNFVNILHSHSHLHSQPPPSANSKPFPPSVQFIWTHHNSLIFWFGSNSKRINLRLLIKHVTFFSFFSFGFVIHSIPFHSIPVPFKSHQIPIFEKISMIHATMKNYLQFVYIIRTYIHWSEAVLLSFCVIFIIPLF